MASPPVTVCVVAAAGDADVQRTVASAAETGWATEVLAVRELASTDPNAAWATLVGRTRTTWSLLLLPGEELGVLREEWLAADLAGEDDALGVVLTGPSMPLPNPFDPGQVRLLRTEARGTSSSVPVTALVVQRPEVVSPLSVPDSQALLALLAGLTRSRARAATAEQLLADAQLLALAGETDGAFVRVLRLLADVPATHHLVPSAARLAALAGLATGRAPEASRLAALMSPEEPDAVWWSTLLLFLANDATGLRAVVGDVDPERRRASTWADLSVALAAAGIERSDVVLEAMFESLGPRSVLADATKLIDQWVALGRDVEELVRRWPASADRALIAYLDVDPTPAALGTWLLVAGAYRDTRGLTSSLVKRLAALAPRLTAEVALDWSRRLAASPYARESLVRRQALAASLPEVRRVLAAAIAIGALEDPSGQQVLARLGPAVPEHDFQNLVVAVDVLARPALAEVLVALASTPDRARRLADLLRSLRAPDRAAAMDERVRQLEGS